MSNLSSPWKQPLLPRHQCLCSACDDKSDHDGHNDNYRHDGYVKHSDHSAKGQHEGHGELSFVSNEHGDQDEHHAELSMSMNLGLGFPPSGP